MHEVRLKYLCTSFSTPITQQELVDEGQYKVYGASGLVGFKNDYALNQPYLGIVKDGAGVGRICRYNGSSSLLGTMAYIVPNNNIELAWLKYAITALDLGKDVGTTTIPHIYFSDYGNKSVTYVEQAEQHRIASYLDQQCAAIDAVLEKTRASIEEYKHLKQAVITQAVTKGVRGDRPMKESGIEWIGEIPQEWKVSRVGLQYNVILGKMVCSTQPDETYTLEPYFCAADVHFDGVTQPQKQMWFSPSEKEQYLVQDGDLLVVEGGAGAGGSAIVKQVEQEIYVQNSIMIARSKYGTDNRFLRYWIESLVKKGYIDMVCNKSTIPHFTKDKLSTMPYLVFDSIEKSQIADYLDQKCAEIDALIAKKNAFLTELEAYKKSLIYEYVTGKKEVPHGSD